MEEQESEVICVSKEFPKKKISLAEYKSKYQPIGQQQVIDKKVGPSKKSVTATNSTLSVKPEMPLKKSKRRRERRKKICLEKPSLNTSVKSLKTEHHTKTNTRKKKKEQANGLQSCNPEKNDWNHDSKFGITEYLSKKKGFSADVKHCHSDFQVHEISLDGSIVHLTKTRMKNPDLRPYTSDQGKPEITCDQLKSVDDMSKTDNREIFRMQDMAQCENESLQYVQFVLYKEKKSTKTAVSDIAIKLRMKHTCFKTAENKSARSITSQLVTVNKEDAVGLLKSQILSIGNFCCTSKPLQLGELQGNHFEIALRNVIGDQCHIETCLKSLEDVGFINYYESQELGFLGNSHLIGKELVLERWQEVIDLILQPWLMSKNRSNLARACVKYKSSRNVHKALKMAREKHSVPTKLWSSIKLHGGNLSKAFNAASPLPLQISYVHAYQCFIWNQIVSKRIAKFGSKMIVGDMVCVTGNNEQHNQRKIIFLDYGNMHRYTIYDVILPLPGHDTIYPENLVASWYIDLFQADGILEKDFNQKSKTYGLGGLYRPMMLRPSDLKWKFVHYDNPDQRLISSDLDRLQQIGLPPVGLQGAYLGLVLEFSLPAFAFPLMALREILKMDMKEATINSLKKKCRSQKRPSPLAFNETNENTCRVTKEPLLETNNSVLDSRPASATSELFQSSPLRKINLESDTVEKQPSRNSLTEQPTCSSSNNEYHLNGITFVELDTIENLPPPTEKRFKEPQVKKEPGATKRPASIIKDSSEELKKNQIIPERNASNQMPQLTVNEGMKDPQTKCVIEESGISRTRKSTFNESCEEPAKKKIKADPDANQNEFYPTVSKFKSIIYLDLTSDADRID